jgi:hypothetical protein
MAEAVDTVFTLGWTLLAWIVALAVVAAVALYALVVIGWWVGRILWRAWRGAWRYLTAPHRASRDSPATPDPERPSDGRTARPLPAWAVTQPLDTEEAA